MCPQRRPTARTSGLGVGDDPVALPLPARRVAAHRLRRRLVASEEDVRDDGEDTDREDDEQQRADADGPREFVVLAFRGSLYTQ